MIHTNQKVVVTGGTGFLAIHSILQLLNRGYLVRTTVRSLKSKDKIFEMLKNGGFTDFSKIELLKLILPMTKTGQKP